MANKRKTPQDKSKLARPHKLVVYLSDSEMAKILYVQKHMNVSRRKIISALLSSETFVFIDSHKELTAELKKQGSNLWQTIQLFRERRITPQDLITASRKCSRAYDCASAILEETQGKIEKLCR